MRLPSVIERTELGTAVDPMSGDIWRVIACRHDTDWPGTENPTTFSCERFARGQWREAVGFFTESDCWQYLAGRTDQTYEITDQYGRDERIVRKGRGIPDAFIRREVAEIAVESKRRAIAEQRKEAERRKRG